MRVVTTMVVLPISRCARRFLGIHKVRRTRRRNPWAGLEKKFPRTADINLPTTPAESVENDP